MKKNNIYKVILKAMIIIMIILSGISIFILGYLSYFNPIKIGIPVLLLLIIISLLSLLLNTYIDELKFLKDINYNECDEKFSLCLDCNLNNVCTRYIDHRKKIINNKKEKK
jgi:hypothetical protein